MTRTQNRTTAAGFPDFSFFQKVSRTICPNCSIYRPLSSKKKIRSQGTTLGGAKCPISPVIIIIFQFLFKTASNRPIQPIFKGYGCRFYTFQVRKLQLQAKYFMTRPREAGHYFMLNPPKYYGEYAHQKVLLQL